MQPASASTPTATATGTMPAIFLAHGSPMLLDDEAWVGELRNWAAALPRPRAILMISAHWEAAPVTLGATTTVPLVYDFYGFPQHYYQVRYAAPGAPELAGRVRALLAPLGAVADDPRRGLDHGAYVPLVAMYPAADIPVLQISLPTMDPRTLHSVGRALSPLRREGVLVVGSGFITHNMRALRWNGGAPPAWATDFDGWTADVLARHDADALLQYRQRAPGVQESLPTHEHFVPLITAAGTTDPAERVTFPITGWTYGAFTKRSVQIG